MLRLVSVALVLTVGLSACDNTLGPESVQTVEVDIARTILTEGESIAISVSATDVDGGSISGSEVIWVSRDPSTVRVEDGALFAVAPGVARIVADVRGARDSVRIRVRFGQLAQGEIGVRLQGQGGVRHATDGRTFMRSVLTLDDSPSFPTHTQITTSLGTSGLADSVVTRILTQPDTLVWITFEGNPTVGPRQLQPFEVDTMHGTLTFAGFEGAMVRISDRDNPLRMELFSPVDVVDLEIDEVIFPAEPGGEGGILRGAVAFEAAGLIIEHDTTNKRVEIVGPASDETLRVYAEFVTDLYEMLHGTARLTATRDTVTTSGFTSASAFSINGAAEFSLTVPGSTDFPASELIIVQSRLEASGIGSIAVDQLDGDTFDPRATPAGTWSYARVLALNEGGSSTEDDITTHGYSTGGEVILTEYRAPAENLYGILRGTYTIHHALRDRDNVETGESLSVSAEFIVPIQPLCWFGQLCE